MSKYTTEALRSVALVGHGAAGKTSLAEALLFATGAIAAKGSVEKGNTVGDSDAQEKEAGHSLTSAVMNFGYEDTHVHLIDTPGYPDFAGQAIGARADSLQVPANKTFKLDPRIPSLDDVLLIRYDFERYGKAAERKRLIERWQREVEGLPR